MKQSNERFNQLQDDRLSDFADQVAEGQMKETVSGADEELLGLERTILRLNGSLPPVSLDEAVIKQMQVRLNARIRRAAQEAKPSFLEKWFSPGLRPQTGFALVVVILLVTLAIFSVSSSSPGSSVTGTAFGPAKNIFIIGILAGVTFIYLWIKRPK